MANARGSGQPPVRQRLEHDARTVDGPVLRTRRDVLLHRPVSRLRPARGRQRRCGHVLHRLDPVHRRGAVQTWIAFPARHSGASGKAAWLAATIQSAGTLFFNVTTYQALQTSLTNSNYDRLVWRPDAFGSICFLISGAIAYHASARHGWLPARGRPGWWQPSSQSARLHLLRDLGRRGLPRSLDRLGDQPGGSQLEHRFGSRMLPHLRAGHAPHRRTFKSPELPRLHRFETDVKRDVKRIV